MTDAPIVFITTYGKLPQAMTYQTRPVCPTYRRPVLHQTTYMRAPNTVTYGKLPRTEPPPGSNSTDSIKKGRRLDLGIVEGIAETNGNVMTVERFEESVKESEEIEENGKVTKERFEDSGEKVEGETNENLIQKDDNRIKKMIKYISERIKKLRKWAATKLEKINQQPNPVETTEEILEQTTEEMATKMMEQSSPKTEEDENEVEKTDETNGNLIQKDDKQIKKMIKYISERIKKLKKKKKKMKVPKVIDADEMKKGWFPKKETAKKWIDEKRANLVKKRMEADNMFKWMRGSWKKKSKQKVRRKRDLSSLQGTFTYPLTYKFKS